MLMQRVRGQSHTAEPLVSSYPQLPPPCSELMLRDNLFEMVTSSRTFYIQVGHLEALKETLLGSLTLKDQPEVF